MLESVVLLIAGGIKPQHIDSMDDVIRMTKIKSVGACGIGPRSFLRS